MPLGSFRLNSLAKYMVMANVLTPYTVGSYSFNESTSPTGEGAGISFNSSKYLLNPNALTISFLYKPDFVTRDSVFTIFNESTPSLSIFVETTGQIRWFFRSIDNSGNFGTSDIRTNTGVLTQSQWNHILFAADFVNQTVHCYVNGISTGFTQTTWAGSGYSPWFNVGTNNTSFSFGRGEGTAALPAYELDGELGYLWIDNHYYDISSSSIREKFYKDGYSIDLGKAGQISGLDTPMIYHNSGLGAFISRGRLIYGMSTTYLGYVSPTFIETGPEVIAPQTSTRPQQVRLYYNAKISTTQSKFGGSSIRLNGYNTDLTVYDHLRTNNPVIPSTGDFTVELWFRVDAVGFRQDIIGQLASFTEGRFQVALREYNQIEAFCGGTGAPGAIVSTSGISANTWYHMAYQRASGVWSLYINGVREGSQPTSSIAIQQVDTTVIGLRGDFVNPLTGYIDEIRISNVARYSSNFTPATTQFTNDENTTLLIHGDGANNSNIIYDDDGSIISRYSISSNSISVNEGSTLTFVISTENVANTTLYYTIESISGTINTSDFSDASLSGSFSLTSNTGSFTKTLASDADTGIEEFRVALRTGSTSGPIVAYSQDIKLITPVLSTLSALTFVSSSATTVTIPGTATTGDLAVLFDTSLSTTTAIPSGWTVINGNTTTGIRTNISYRILTEGQAGTSITGLAGTTRKILIVYRGNIPITSVSTSTVGSQATTATPTNQTITGVVGPMIAFASYSKTASTTPSLGWTVGTPTDYQNVSTSGIYVKALITNSGTPANTTISMSDAGTNILQSFTLQPR